MRFKLIGHVGYEWDEPCTEINHEMEALSVEDAINKAKEYIKQTYYEGYSTLNAELIPYEPVWETNFVSGNFKEKRYMGFLI